MRSYIFIWISSSQTWVTMSSDISDLYQCVEQNNQDYDTTCFEKEEVYVWYHVKESRDTVKIWQQVKWLIKCASKNCLHLKQKNRHCASQGTTWAKMLPRGHIGILTMVIHTSSIGHGCNWRLCMMTCQNERLNGDILHRNLKKEHCEEYYVVSFNNDS